MARRTRGYVELEWICPNCSTRNPGPTKSCTNCGAPQPDNVQFQRKADEKLVADQESVKAAQAGPDYVCPYCGTRNSARAKVCSKCGGDLVEARRRASGAELQANTGPREVTCTNCGAVNPTSRSNCARCGSPLPQASAPSPEVPAAGQAGGAKGKKGSRWWLWAGLAALAVCAGAILLFAVPSSTLTATVSDVRWETSVPVQELRAVQYADERGSPRSGAYDVSCRDESREVCTERIVDQGNGFGEVVEDCRTETEQYCSYTVDEWETIQTYTLDGRDFAPVLAQPSITAGQRLGDASEDYTVVFSSDAGSKTYSPPNLADFSLFEIGSTWTLSLNAAGAILDVKP
ncbi:MAG TPA: zinc ribbon domain-containing protein [Anaerolineales bacterium]|nr:zinc ribbon domain-containing protein [Anaerolineales bacterium]